MKYCFLDNHRKCESDCMAFDSKAIPDPCRLITAIERISKASIQRPRAAPPPSVL